MDVTTILFDLDETLCEHIHSGPKRLSKAFLRLDFDQIFTYDEYQKESNKITGTSSDIRLREICFMNLARQKGYDESVGLQIADAYHAITDYSNMKLLPEASQVLEALYGDYQLGIVTNGGPDTQSPKIDALSLRDWFDTVIFAGFETVAKPDPEPFQQALNELEANKEEAIHVGNSLKTDIAGANNCEVTSIWKPNNRSSEASGKPIKFNSFVDTRPDYQIDSLMDLLDEPWKQDTLLNNP